MKKQKTEKRLIELKNLNLNLLDVDAQRQIKGGDDSDVQCPFCQRHVN